MHKARIALTVMLPFFVLLGSLKSTGAAPEKETTGHPGRIRGTVRNAVDNQPVADAYVGVGDFWDSGGSNHSRHRKNGLYAKTRTDAQGRFEVDGLVYRDSHSFFVTHPDFIRHDHTAKVSANEPATDLVVLLHPAAKIKATVVDESGTPITGLWLIRLEALDGHRFIAPGGDPHLSAFANSTWIQGPMTRRGKMYFPVFTFSELKPGEYCLDAVRFQMKTIIPNQSDRYAMPFDPTGFAYHGGIAKIIVTAGRTTEVEIRPQNHGTTLLINMPEIENKDKFPQLAKVPQLISLSRNPGLKVWDSDLIYSLEDSRLGRIQEQALFFTLAGETDSITIRNLPPGEYTVFAGPAMLMNATKVRMAANQTLIAQPPPIQIQEKPGNVSTGQLRRRVQLDAPQYSLQELCRLCTEQTQSRPRITPDPALADQKIVVKPGSYEIWDLLEELYADKHWYINEDDNQTLLIQE
jgi:hypothetical protein